MLPIDPYITHRQTLLREARCVECFVDFASKAGRLQLVLPPEPARDRAGRVQRECGQHVESPEQGADRQPLGLWDAAVSLV